MLTQIYHRHNKARLLGFQATTTAAPSATLNIGSMDASVARAGAGQPTITPRYAFARRMLVAGATENGVGAGSYVGLASLASASAAAAQFLSSGGSGTDGAGDILALGWDSANTDETGLQEMDGTIQTPRIIAARIDGTNTVVLQGKKDVSVTKASTGVYTVTFNGAFGRNPTIALLGEGGSYRSLTYVNKTPGSVGIRAYDVSGVAADATFHLIAYGQQGRDEFGRMFNPIMSNYQLIPTAFSVNAGSTTFRVGGEDASAIVKNGTGDFTITFKKPFAKIPVVVGSSITQRKLFLISVSATQVRAAPITAGGSASDTDFDLLVFGSSERGE